MVNTFFIGDTHIGHTNILGFKRDDGSPLRNFSSIENHDEHIINCWNSVVRPQDKIYHLGDIVMNKKYLPLLKRLNGHKRLVMGNHDVENFNIYMEYFENICAYRIIDKILFSHIPVHTDSVGRYRANVHGHLHSDNVMTDKEWKLDDIKGLITERIPNKRYLCVSCEQINYTPISLEEINRILKDGK